MFICINNIIYTIDESIIHHSWKIVKFSPIQLDYFNRILDVVAELG